MNEYAEAIRRYWQNRKKPRDDWGWTDVEQADDITPQEDLQTVEASFKDLQTSIERQRMEMEQQKEQQRIETQNTAESKINTQMPKYGSIFERVGDMFEANSPQDKHKRLSANQPELHENQQSIEQQTEERIKNMNFTEGQMAERIQYYRDQGIDLQKAMQDKRTYDEFKEQNKGKSLAQLTLANKIPQEAKEWEQTEKKIRDIESDFQDYKSNQGPQSIPQQIEKGVARGAHQVFDSLPGSAKQLAGGIVDIMAPEGSRVDKFAQFTYNSGTGDNDEVTQRIIDEGWSPNETDNKLVGDVSAGFGSLLASVTPVGVLGKAKAATSVAGTMFGVNTGAHQLEQSKEAGSSDLEAAAVAVTAGLVEGTLEKFGLDKFLGADGNLAKRVGTRIATEGVQEASQSLAQSGFDATYSDVDFTEAIKKAAYEGGIGAIVGGGAGLTFSVAEDLKAKGVDEDTALETGMRVNEKIQSIMEEESAGIPPAGIPHPEGNLSPQEIARRNEANARAGSLEAPEVKQPIYDPNDTALSPQDLAKIDEINGVRPKGAPKPLGSRTLPEPVVPQEAEPKIFYHGTDDVFDIDNIKPGTKKVIDTTGVMGIKNGRQEFGNEIGFSITSDKARATDYGKNVIELRIKPDAKIAKAKDLPEVFKQFDDGKYFNQADAVRLAKEKGFDGVDLHDLEMQTPKPTKNQEIQIFNTAVIEKAPVRSRTGSSSQGRTAALPIQQENAKSIPNIKDSVNQAPQPPKEAAEGPELQIEAENTLLEKNAGKTIDVDGIPLTIPKDYKAYRRTITGDTVDVKRIKTDTEYFRQAYESTFAKGHGTDEKLYKTLSKELVPKGSEPSSYLADLYGKIKDTPFTGQDKDRPKGSPKPLGMSQAPPVVPEQQPLPAPAEEGKEPKFINQRKLQGAETGAPRKESKLAKGIESKAIEEKLSKGYSDVQGYETVNMKDQAERAASLIDSDPERAKDIALGKRPPPKDILPESLLVAVEQKAIKENDAETMRELATGSTLSGQASVMGQRIRTLAERDSESPVAAIMAIQKAREEAAQKRLGTTVAKAKKQATKQIKRELVKTAPTKDEWADFIESIRC